MKIVAYQKKAFYKGMLIHKKDDIEFVTEFPCLLGHPVVKVTGLPTKNVTVKTTWKSFDMTIP